MANRLRNARSFRVSDDLYHQLELDAKRLGYPSRHAYIVYLLKAPKTDKATETTDVETTAL
jgi:hypothetical protein